MCFAVLCLIFYITKAYKTRGEESRGREDLLTPVLVASHENLPQHYRNVQVQGHKSNSTRTATAWERDVQSTATAALENIASNTPGRSQRSATAGLQQQQY